MSGSSLLSRRHYRWFVFRGFGHSPSIFLEPFAPPELPGFVATMVPLTPVRRFFASTLRLIVDCSTAVSDDEHRLSPDRSPCFTIRIFPSFCLQPPHAAPADTDWFSSLGLTVAKVFGPSAPTRQGSARRHLGFAIYQQARRNAWPNRVRYPTD